MVIQFAMMLGQPLLAVLAGVGRTKRDSQEWLAHKDLDPLQLHSIS